MGKRRLHEQVYYQCDWTGFPMSSANCYMPSWVGKRLVKRGNYCNWESVVAHASHIYDVEKKMDEKELTQIILHVQQQCGVVPDHFKYHFSFLAHFKDDLSKLEEGEQPMSYDADDYHALCCAATDEVTAVKIDSLGNPPGELIMDPHHGKLTFEDYLTRPWDTFVKYETLTQLILRRTGIPKDRDLLVYYWPGKNGQPFNTLASKLFRVDIYGDALIVLQSKEACFRPRQRCLNFSVELFNELYLSKNKKSTKKRKEIDATLMPPPSMTTAEYKEAKQSMQSSLNVAEAQMSEGAVEPSKIVRGAKMPRSTGAELSEVVQHLGIAPVAMIEPVGA